MEIIKELQKQATANSTDPHRMLDAIKAGDYKLSVQGSTFHYCLPRKSIPVDCYTSMELAIFTKKNKMLSINRSKKIKGFKRYNELLQRADSLNTSATVYGYVDVDLLNDLYVFLTTNN